MYEWKRYRFIRFSDTQLGFFFTREKLALWCKQENLDVNVFAITAFLTHPIQRSIKAVIAGIIML